MARCESRQRPLLIPLVIAAALSALAAPAQGNSAASGAESQLQHALERLGRGEVNAALGELDSLLARYPNFRLAHLVRGDLLLARAGRQISALGNTGHAATGRLEELRAEALARLRASRERPNGELLPRYFLRLDPAHRHAILVDASRSRIYLYENTGGVPRLVLDYYTTLGKGGIAKQREGDQKTPIGVYHVTSQIRDRKLPDLYGWGALPISYPNEWDRLAGRTGYGIWIHGVPSDTYARAPLASDGCVALANPELEELAARVQPGNTAVIIAERIEWVGAEALRAEREAFLAQLETWRADWESRDTERYLGHYAQSFRSSDMDLAAWRTHKRRVNAGKAWIKVALENMSALRSPGAQPLIAVTFDQDYRSSNLSQRTRKRQYWVMERGRWKIAYEAPAGAARLVLPESFPRG